MIKLLLVIDMQNDFIHGSLGTKEAEAIVDSVVEKIKNYQGEEIIATRDTHETNYLMSREGKYLPVQHCIKHTVGWELNEKVSEALGPDVKIFDKPTFGSVAMADYISDLYELHKEEGMCIELVGLCTDICVVSNALLLKAKLPECDIKVDASCCAGVTPKSHEAALLTMQMCQIIIEDGSNQI